MARRRAFVVLEVPAGTAGRVLAGVRQLLEASGMPRGGYRRLAVLPGDTI